METFDETVDFLFGLRNRGSKFGLERMEHFADAAGHPENRFPVVHVAGTNGKGSVCAMVEQMLRAAGYRTGLYTSPHLVYLGERVRIDGEALSEAEIVEKAGALRRLARLVAEEGSTGYPSFFEFMTLMAFQSFAEKGVDCAVVEVGLGGRLDATNIVSPQATAITSVGLDHCDILGDTLDAIAREKAGILKPGVPLVTGRLPEEAVRVVRDRVNALGCHWVAAGDRFSAASLPETNLVGGFQQWNAAVALLLLEAITDRLPVDPRIAADALGRVRWPGRWDERVIGGTRYIIDCTHNPEGAVELGVNLRERVGPPAATLDVVVGSLGRERARAVLETVAPWARQIHIGRPQRPRALSFAELRRLVAAAFPGEIRESSLDEIFSGGDASSLSPEVEPVLLTGSLYLVGEVLARLGPGGSTALLQDRI